jgi:hypothetical protein
LEILPAATSSAYFCKEATDVEPRPRTFTAPSVVAVVAAAVVAVVVAGTVAALAAVVCTSLGAVVWPVVFPVDPHPKSVSNATPRAAVQRHPMRKP